MADENLFYVIRPGDTLSEVAQHHGTTLKALCRINGIADPDKVEADQIIALTAGAICKVSILLIDWDRNPIADADVRLEYCDKQKVFKSRTNGTVPDILTETPDDMVKVSIARPDGSWEKIAEVPSGWGNKLVTLKSPKLKIKSETLEHPKGISGNPIHDTTTANNISIIQLANPSTTEAEGQKSLPPGS